MSKEHKKTFEHWEVVTLLLMIYDFMAVAVSYFAALWVRFDCKFSSIETIYLHTYYKSILFYAAFCVIVFWFMRLYKSILRFASYSELMRVTAATLISSIVYVVALTGFVLRMPISYFIIGMVCQFITTLGIRFSYRFILLLRGRANKNENKKKVMLIGAGAAGQLIFRDIKNANQARKWSTQARENAAWYQNEEVGYNYRMSNVIAGVIRNQYEHLKDHISQKKNIYEKYRDGLKGLPVKMNPFDQAKAEPNYWLSSMLIDEDAMCRQVRSETEALYVSEKGKSCPTEILEAISSINAEGRPIWKPMHMQPMYRMHEFVTVNGSGRAKTNAYIAGGIKDVGADIFQRGLCLPSDNKMTAEQQDRIIEVIRACFE